MKKMKEMISVLLLATILSMVPCALHAAVVNIIPMPVKLSLQRGEFRLPSRVSICLLYTSDAADDSTEV